MSSNVIAGNARLDIKGNAKRMSAQTSNTFQQAGALNHDSGKNAAPGQTATQPRVRIKTVALPVEHGGWGLSLEPVALGLLVAPSGAGFCLALTTVAAFLARHPLKIAVADWRRGRRFPRTCVAEAFAVIYGAIALVSFVCAVLLGTPVFLLPLAAALPLAVIQLAYDFTGRSRAVLPELSGAVAMSAVAASLALAGGFALWPALALWAILAARVLPTILYVRARLRAARGEQVSSGLILLMHALACALVVLLFIKGTASLLALAALAVLLVRAIVGLNSRPVSAKRVGITELLYGAMLVAAVAAGHALGI